MSEEKGRAKALFDALASDGMLEYGSFIPGELVRSIVGIELPAVGTRAQFNAAALVELAAIDGVREMLLNEGKYLSGSADGYRILTPGENSGQIDRYLAHAQNKIRRARKLERTSPPCSTGKPDQSAARIAAIARGMRRTVFGPDKDVAG